MLDVFEPGVSQNAPTFYPSYTMPSDLSPLWISLRAALLATLLTFLLGIAAARWMLTYRGKARSLLDGLFTLPLVLPPTVVGFLLLLLLGRNSPVGQGLNHLGISVIFTWPATVIAATVVAFPLMYKTTLGAFEQIESDLLHCARTLGASEWRIFWQILLPLAWPGLIAGTILAFARALGEFGATLMVAGSIPGVTQTIPIAIFFAAEAGRMAEALAWVLLMVGISLGVIVAIHQASRVQDTHKVAHASTNPVTRRLLNFSLLGQWCDRLSYSSDRADWVSVRQPSRWPQASLVVQVEKPLAGFTLKTAFSAGGHPVGILGGSGSGKSMTLRCIAGLETPTTGQIILNGRVLFDAQKGINVPSRQRRIGVVFQNYALFPHLNVVQNIAFGLQAVPRDERSRRIRHYLDQMHLSGLEHRYPHQLSGGQQQRVALARAMATNPDALLLDEPLSALDTDLRSRIEKLLAEVLAAYGGVTLFVTHNLEEVYRVCPQLLVMDEGRAIATGSKYEVFERPQTARVAKLTGCKNFSRVKRRGDRQVEALDWNCFLETLEPVPDDVSQVGVRAHQLVFLDVPMPSSVRRYGEAVSGEPSEYQPPNVFACWLASASETPHRMTLYLKLQGPPTCPTDYHIQAEVFKEKWMFLKDQPFPWHLQIDPLRLILL